MGVASKDSEEDEEAMEEEEATEDQDLLLPGEIPTPKEDSFKKPAKPTSR